MITIVGGIYQEHCMKPKWEYTLGSGGRAAVCIASRNTKVDLHSFISDLDLTDFQPIVDAFEINFSYEKRSENIYFDYFYPLSSPRIYPEATIQLRTFSGPIGSENIIVFGMLEAVPTVHGRRVVYDPQNGYNATAFHQSGSTAEELIYILNLDELIAISGEKDSELAVRKLFHSENVSAVIVKKGPLGAFVYVDSHLVTISPPYRSRSVFKIGSGDVFTAAFAYFWMVHNLSIIDAADLASRSVAYYVGTRDLQILDRDELLKKVSPPIGDQIGKIYLACPFFSIEQLWIANQTKIHLEMLGVEVFSPMHEVGIGGDPFHLAEMDLAGLRECSCVIAILNGNDPGSIFEIGYAIKHGIPVSILFERGSPTDLTMFQGTECKIFDDYTSAIYSAVWDAFR